HEYRRGAALHRDGGEPLEQRRGDAAPAEGLRDGEIVEVDLAALPLEFAQLVGDQSAGHLAARQRDYHYGLRVGEQCADIAVARRLRAIGLGLVECNS